MKSIKQQYIDLQEGNLSQANFMRNLRMTLPQYVTNVTSFEDSVRILKNKGILTEADTKTKWTNTSGKGMYDQFSEINNLNGQEVLIGIDYEMEKNHELTKEAAAKIVIKNLKKNPIYYTSSLMAGKEGYEPETMGPKADIEARKMQFLDKNMGNVVDKKMGMQPVKGIEKPKKDADAKSETNKVEKGVSLMSLIAKTVRGVKKMDATGEKMKKIVMKEGIEGGDDENTFRELMKKYDWYAEMSDDSRKWDAQQSMEKELKKLAKTIGAEKAAEIWNEKAPNNRKVKPSFFEVSENKVVKTIFDINANINKGINDIAKGDKKKPTKAEARLSEQISQYIKETMDGRDNLTDVTGENQ